MSYFQIAINCMKNFVTTFLSIILLLFVGCKNDDIDPLNIEGKWELESSFNGWIGAQTYLPGNGQIIIFGKSNYEFYRQDTLFKSGTYKIIQATSSPTNTVGNRIIYDNNTDAINIFVEIKDRNLNISFDAPDAGSGTYRKIPND